MRNRATQQRPRHAGVKFDGDVPKWFNSPVRFHEGTLQSVADFLPEFERRSFALTQPGNDRSRLNERLDTIVRRPFGEDGSFIPVGVVSKGYTLAACRTFCPQGGKLGGS